MKKAIITLFLTGIISVNLLSQGIPAGDNALLDNLVKSRFSIKKELISSDTLKKVITGNLYLVKAEYADQNSTGALFENRFVIKDGKLLEPEDLSTDKKLEVLFSVVKKEFTIKTETDAKIFEKVIDAFYPLGWSNEKYRQHLKKDGKWYFVRGEFFDNKEAVIVTLDATQRITDISFSLEAIKK
ncbi:MAG: hypothetical protein U0T33_01100 [Bacteroidales bacterium]